MEDRKEINVCIHTVVVYSIVFLVLPYFKSMKLLVYVDEKLLFFKEESKLLKKMGSELRGFQLVAQLLG